MKAIDGLASNNHPHLIPNFKKPERKLLSVFMAVLEIVPEFRGTMLKLCGYGSGKTCKYQSYMEPHYNAPQLPNVYPDGLIVCQRGQSNWSAFIEAKAENNKIRPDQILEYADLASRLDIDAVISISNEYAVSPVDLPYHLAGNKRRKRDIYHLSWPEIRTAIGLFLGASNTCNEAEISVLQHALNFMHSERSGVETYDLMPQDWAKFVESANTALGFSANTSGVMEIVRGWQQERRDLCAKLNGEFGGGIELRHRSGARSTPTEGTNSDKKFLAEDYQLTAAFFFKESKCSLDIVSDLKACSHRIALQLNPPDGRKAKASISWLAGKLFNLSSKQYSIGITWPGHGKDTRVKLEHFLNYPETIYEGRKEAPKHMTIIARHRDVRRFKSRKKFIEDLESTAINLVEEASRTGLLGR